MVHARNGGQQRACVGMHRICEQHLAGRDLDQVPRTHDRDAIRHVVHHREVVGDEEIGQSELALQVLQEVEHLRLHRYVQGGHRLIAYQQLGIQGESARDADALALSAREAVGIAGEKAGDRGRPGT